MSSDDSHYTGYQYAECIYPDYHRGDCCSAQFYAEEHAV